MSRGKNLPDRSVLLADLDQEIGRKVNMAILMFMNAVADRVGLSLTDLFCGELLSRTGALSAGEMAELTGLTTGAITGVIDRLEKNGYVRRENDPEDRRRVMVRAIPDKWEAIGEPLFGGLNKRLAELYEGYSDEELAAVNDFLDRMSAVYDQEAMALRDAEREASANYAAQLEALTTELASQSGQENLSEGKGNRGAKLEPNSEALITVRIGKDMRGGKNTKEMSAPLRDVKAGILEWGSGSSTIQIDGQGMPDLYRARFSNEIPVVRVHEGKVAVQYRQQSLFGRAGGKAALTLNAGIPWTLDVRTTASKLNADLSSLDLTGVMVAANASHVRLNLPKPQGTISIRIECMSGEIHIQRPAGVPVRVQVEGTWSRLMLDKQFNRAVQAEVVESPKYKNAEARYSIQVTGGSNKIVMEERK